MTGIYALIPKIKGKVCVCESILEPVRQQEGRVILVSLVHALTGWTSWTQSWLTYANILWIFIFLYLIKITADTEQGKISSKLHIRQF